MFGAAGCSGIRALNRRDPILSIKPWRLCVEHSSSAMARVKSVPHRISPTFGANPWRRSIWRGLLRSPGALVYTPVTRIVRYHKVASRRALAIHLGLSWQDTVRQLMFD
jgi:hypothetical protein